MKLPRNFYNQPTLKVAQNLLGCFLIHQVKNKKIVGRIVETEAYIGPHDLASHASHGCTPRNKVMFGPAGYAYVYLVYGLHYMFNIVTESRGFPAAVLVRAVEPLTYIKGEISASRLQGQSKNLANGPAKLTKYFKINKTCNGLDICGNKIWLENKINHGFQTVAAPRIGVDYAGPYKNKLWRFYIDDNDWVSKK